MGRKKICARQLRLSMGGVMADSWKARISWLVNTYANGSPAEFADKLAKAGAKKASRQNVDNWINKGSEPRVSYISAIVRALPRVNPDWLLTGLGPRERDPKAKGRASVYAAGLTEAASALRDLAADLEARAGVRSTDEGEEPSSHMLETMDELHGDGSDGAEEGSPRQQRGS